MSEDLIRRSDAIKALQKLGHEVVVIDKVCSLGVATEFIDAIRAIPSTDRPQGKWIDAEIPLESGGSMPIQACNLCKTFYPLAYTGGGHRFCPNCGARMKGADDE